MGEAYSTHGEDENFIQTFSREISNRRGDSEIDPISILFHKHHHEGLILGLFKDVSSAALYRPRNSKRRMVRQF